MENDKIWMVMCESLRGDEYIVSVHRTLEGAEKEILRIKSRTTDLRRLFVDEYDLLD